MIVIDTPRPTNPGSRLAKKYKRHCHMLSTHTGERGREELTAFAKRIGLRPEWIHNTNTTGEHFDLFDSMISRAVNHGAVLWKHRRIGELIRHKRRST